VREGAPAAPHLAPAGLVLAIFGPTASGKTDVAEAIAERTPAEIVSADSMQVYRGLPILTNQSSRPARLVGLWPLAHEASVGSYAALAHAAVDEVLAAGRTPVVVGGTGLYLRAALAELAVPPPPAPGARERWERTYDTLGPEATHALLAERDPDAAAAVHANDRRRVVRAHELADAGATLRPQRDRLWSEETRHPTLVVGLDVPRETVVARIEARTQAMLERGVEDEVRRALAEPISHTAQAIHGLRDFADLPRDEAVETYNRRVRRYAAYQRKWLRRIPGIVIIDGDRPPGEIADDILEVARTRKQLPAPRAG
jgi:tRNA dimethylallyltransferase